MRRSKKLLLVYAEIRRAVGHQATAGELLEIAERLVDLTDDRDVIGRCGTIDLTPPGSVPLDRAFGDGGWALLHDCYTSGLFGDDDSWRPQHHAVPVLENWA